MDYERLRTIAEALYAVSKRNNARHARELANLVTKGIVINLFTVDSVERVIIQRAKNTLVQ